MEEYDGCLKIKKTKNKKQKKQEILSRHSSQTAHANFLKLIDP